jgi:hypothetical protein
MTQITLSDELARQISEASAPIVLVDSRGRKLGQLAPLSAEQAEHLSDEELAEIKRRMATDNGIRYTTAQVLQYLRELAPE